MMTRLLQRQSASLVGCAVLLAVAAAGAPAARAAPGDTLKVTAERVNLRAGPSDGANVRTQVTRGEQLLEVRDEGNWRGVRVLRTGEEGWIFGDLVEPVTSSTLGGGGEGGAVKPAGFEELSRDFDRVMGSLGQRFGFPLFNRVTQPGNNVLEARMTPDWLRAGSDDEHILAATAIYQMWKNHQNSAPVRVVVLYPDGKPYITIDDTQGAPSLLSVASE